MNQKNRPKAKLYVAPLAILGVIDYLCCILEIGRGLRIQERERRGGKVLENTYSGIF